jgi:hypothetical protein
MRCIPGQKIYRQLSAAWTQAYYCPPKKIYTGKCRKPETDTIVDFWFFVHFSPYLLFL